MPGRPTGSRNTRCRVKRDRERERAEREAESVVVVLVGVEQDALNAKRKRHENERNQPRVLNRRAPSQYSYAASTAGSITASSFALYASQNAMKLSTHFRDA